MFRVVGLAVLAGLGGGGCIGAAEPGGGVSGATSVDDDGGQTAEYPDGPFGNALDDTFPRMTFVDRQGGIVDLADDYESTLEARVLFFTTSWCSPCVPDAEALAANLEEYHPDSAAFGVLFENLSGGSAEASDADAYNDSLDSFEFLADPGRAVDAVFEVASSLPRTVVLDTATMQVAYIGTGHDMVPVVEAVIAIEAD